MDSHILLITIYFCRCRTAIIVISMTIVTTYNIPIDNNASLCTLKTFVGQPKWFITDIFINNEITIQCINETISMTVNASSHIMDI